MPLPPSAALVTIANSVLATTSSDRYASAVDAAEEKKKIYLKLFLITKAMLPFPQIPDLQYIKYILLTKSN